MTRSRIAVLVALLIVGAVMAGLAVRANREPDQSAATEQPTASATPIDPDLAAPLICRRVFVDFVEQIRVDAPVSEVLVDLRATLDIARDAGVPTVLLMGGVGTLIEGIETDDRERVDIALRVLRNECDYVSEVPQ